MTNSMAKLYDMILCSRLHQWFKPCREQAGAQRKRGCLEHIVTLRLLTDSARRRKKKLFVVFIGFSKAYDTMQRPKLFMTLKRLGCGMVMLAAVVAMYHITQSVLGSAVATSTVGVRQGLSTSCILFVIYVDQLIKMVKQKCNPEPFIDWLHTLIYMDDTVLLATTRDNMIKKFRIVCEFCEEYGMKVNEDKTKFFVINGQAGDADPMYVNGLSVYQCDSYVYLGSPFTCDGSVSSAVKLHAQNKLCHVLKFVSFTRKKNDIPFIVKRRLFDAALMSSLVYGCESWVGADIKPVKKLYNWAMKELLGVRRATTSKVCYAELGYPSRPDLIRQKQHKYFHSMWTERRDMTDDPLAFNIKYVMTLNTTLGKTVTHMINSDVPTMSSLLCNVHNDIANSQTTRCNVYKTINPRFEVHDIYIPRDK